jgi:hypothetical protein
LVVEVEAFPVGVSSATATATLGIGTGNETAIFEILAMDPRLFVAMLTGTGPDASETSTLEIHASVLAVVAPVRLHLRRATFVI